MPLARLCTVTPSPPLPCCPAELLCRWRYGASVFVRSAPRNALSLRECRGGRGEVRFAIPSVPDLPSSHFRVAQHDICAFQVLPSHLHPPPSPHSPCPLPSAINQGTAHCSSVNAPPARQRGRTSWPATRRSPPSPCFSPSSSSSPTSPSPRRRAAGQTSSWCSHACSGRRRASGCWLPPSAAAVRPSPWCARSWCLRCSTPSTPASSTSPISWVSAMLVPV